VLGLGMSGVWAPLAATATRNLPMHQAGAGAGVYNATRLSSSTAMPAEPMTEPTSRVAL
jgi:hypothetical protein